MRTIDRLPHAVREFAHVEVPMPDGCILAARIWMPEGAESAPVPAILEYIPYRKNDLTRERDAIAHPYIAGHGYAVVRIDLRGAGESDGVLRDEYLSQELQDGCDAIRWIAEQPWCDGSLGMIGISWGGFNGLQIAALRPPALKAIVTVCSTDDRYADDVHFMGGCLLLDNLSWASVMFGYNSLPPDPRHRPDWRELWMRRLEGSGLWLANWLEHQRRDAFWKHGSVCEDYAQIEVPVYAIGGWADGYCRAVFRLMENLPGPRKGLIGPWAHMYPHQGVPGPAIAFLQETLRWWDHWLKGRDTGIMDEPMLRLFMQDPAPPRAAEQRREGRWVAEPCWPSPNIGRLRFAFVPVGRLTPNAGAAAEETATIRSPLSVGLAGGKWCPYAAPVDLPADQRIEDGGSLVFETKSLAEAVEIAGDPVLELRLSSDRPVAQVAARLLNVAPDGTETRVSFGVLNLTHRESDEQPQPLTPGAIYSVRVALKHVAQRFERGHRIRLGLSSSYFPMIWPAPESARLTLFLGGSVLDLPIRTPSSADAALAPFPEPEGTAPPQIELLAPGELRRRVVQDLVTGRTETEVVDTAGSYRIVEDDLTVEADGRERYAIDADDPASAMAETVWTRGLSRGDWRVRSVAETVLSCDAGAFRIRARLRAWEGDELAFEREWGQVIPRDLV